MRLELHYKSFLKSSLTPMTPLYTGSWTSQFSTKWLGIAAELSYNPYLRNGWVSVDTGVKGAVGSPLIEFSTWESEDSSYNITIPNSFSYRFFFRGDRCVSQFLARSSVEAKEWWFASSSVDTILNSWNGRVFSKSGFAARNRIKFNSIALANYRFWNFIPKALRSVWGLIPLTLNEGLGWSSKDQKLRDLSISFLYLSRLVKHRIARIKLYLYEKISYSRVNRGGLQVFFCEQIFLKTIAQSVTTFSKRNFSLNVTGASSIKLTFSSSFENLLGGLCTVLFFFIEFKESQVTGNFFSVLLKNFLEELVTLFWISAEFSRDVLSLRVKVIASFVSRRIFNFLMVTQLSAYSFMSLLIHSVKAFVGQLRCAEVEKSLIGSLELRTSLYAYKLRQLAAVVVQETGLGGTLNRVFLSNKISTKNLLSGYAKHRGRGLRLFRGWQTFRIKKRRFNFIGRKTQNHLSVTRKKFPSGDAGFIFSRRLKRLRRALKLPSSTGQFTFLFFWSFQFFNFAQLNLKKRKFFFLAMRVAYFFKAFLRFFKFYSFYFKLLRRLDLSGADLYSDTGDFFLNVKTYCLLLFKKFTRLAANFRIFCVKVFVLKWKRSSTVALHEVYRLRCNALTVLNLSGISTVRLGAAYNSNSNRNLAVWSKFLAWSYATFNLLSSSREMHFTSFRARKYLQYLLKLRASYLRLLVGKLFGDVRGSAMLTDISTLGANLFTYSIARQVAGGIFRSGLLFSKMSARSQFSALLRTSCAAFRGTYFKKNNYFYFIRAGALTRLSSAIVYTFAKECAALRGYLRNCTSKKVKRSINRFKALRLTSPRFRSYLITPYLGFVARVQFNSGYTTTKPTSFLTYSPTILKTFDSTIITSLLAVKRFLLIWKGLTRVKSRYASAETSNFGYERFWHKALGDVFCRTTSVSALGDLSQKYLEISAQPAVVFDVCRKKLFTEPLNYNLQLLSENKLLSNLSVDREVPVRGLLEVLRIARLRVPTRVTAASNHSLLAGSAGNSLSVFKSTPLLHFSATGTRARVLRSSHTANFAINRMPSIFTFLWGSYLDSLMSFTRISNCLKRDFSARAWSVESFLWLGLGAPTWLILLTNLIQFAVYSHAYFFAINSFSALKIGAVRGMLTGASINALLKAAFIHKFRISQKCLFSCNRVLSELDRVSTFTGPSRSTSFESVLQYSKTFSCVALKRTGVLIERLRLSCPSLSSKSISSVLPIMPVVFDLPWVTSAGNLKFFNSAGGANSTFLQFKAGFTSGIESNSYVKGAFKLAVALRVNVCRKALRLCRWLAARLVRSNLIEVVRISKMHSLSYLRNILRVLHTLTRTHLRVGVSASTTISPEMYKFRSGKFFNAVRGVRPLKLLTYAKRIGIWPRKLRLRPKKTRVRRAYEINVAKNKQALVPDKNFKMPPSIFSRENYDSMNLVWDFPNEDYKFAYVNTLAKVREWRFTRKQMLRSLMFKIRRRLKARYLRRTFRYRRFLRKRWFRKKLKKLAYRALVRSLSKLNALTNLRSIYKGGSILTRFANNRLYHSSALVYALLLSRFVTKVYARFLRAKLALKANFLKNLKLRFLFVLMRSFFKKMISFLGAFVWTYQLVFGGGFAAVWLFGKLGALLLTAPRIYSLGASYYWSEPLYLFNTRLMSNYVAEDFFAVYCLPDFYVIRTIGPDYYPYHNLIASLPWRSRDVGLFTEYPTFMASDWFKSAVSQIVFRVSDILDKTEGLNLFQNVVCNLFENCGFKLWLPVRREHNRVTVTRRVVAYSKPLRKASMLRLLKKLTILRSNKLAHKFNLSAVRQSRLAANVTSFVNTPYSFFTRLPLRGAYITLFKHKLDKRLYKLLCRAAKIVANMQWHSKPAPLKVRVGGELYLSRSQVTLSGRKFNRIGVRRGSAGVGTPYRKVRKIMATRRIAAQGITRLESVRRTPNIFVKVPRWKRRTLFRKRVSHRSTKN